MDSYGASIAFAVAYAPVLLWLLCGAVAGGARQLADNFDAEKAPAAPRDAAPSGGSGAVHLIISTMLELVALVVDTALNMARTLLSFVPVVLLLGFTFTISYVSMKYSREFLFTADAVYESVRPNIVEAFLQAANFARAVFAITIAAWNALIELLLIPVRMIFDAGFACGGTKFLLEVSNKGAAIFRELAKVLIAFFEGWSGQNELDVDVTALSKSGRVFLLTFVDIVECSCQTIARPVTQTVAQPLWNSMTDVFLNNATRVVVKAIEVPYALMTTGTTTLEPIFDLLLGETDGVLAAGAGVLNAHLEKVLEYVQQDLPEAVRFSSPPLFSIHHRAIAAVLEVARALVKTASAIPSLINEHSAEIANVLRDKASLNKAAFHAGNLTEVVTLETFGGLHEFFRPAAELFNVTSFIVIHGAEMLYNLTLTGAVGVGALDHSDESGWHRCMSEIKFSDAPLARIRYSLLLFADRYAMDNVPLQILAADKLREILVGDLLAVAAAESLYSSLLTAIKLVRGYVQIWAHMTDGVLRLRDVRYSCINNFRVPAHQQFTDTLTSLPNLVTSLLDFRDTADSGYANLVCARSTHVNHIYSGSLKAYVLSSRACAASFEESGEKPKCTYRDPDKEK